MSAQPSLKSIVALCKRRGFVYPGSEIYGGFANTYSYGPYGAQLKKNVKDLWWQTFVQGRDDIVPLDGPILLNPRVWQASGHSSEFADALVDCKTCKARFRVDLLVQEAVSIDVEGLDFDQMDQIIRDQSVACPKCGARDFSPARQFNLMFQTDLSKTSEAEDRTYLRPETAQAIFLDFKNIVDTTRARLPFGVGQIGKAFRNEITPGNFLYRLIEFEQMEIEYFTHQENWQENFEHWLDQMRGWCGSLGLAEGNLRLCEHPPEKLSHYSKRTVDVEFRFPFGWSELYGLAYRGDFDLNQHSAASGRELTFTDPLTKERIAPHVIEPTFGVDRTVLALLCSAYEEEKLASGDSRCVLHLSPKIAPVQCAIFPLMAKSELVEIAQKLYRSCRAHFFSELDLSGSIGKRYRRQDELGTPHCITIDYQTLEDHTVTLRERDSMVQERVAIAAVVDRILSKLG